MLNVVTKNIILILLFQCFAFIFEILTKLMELEVNFFLGTWITAVFSQISAPTRRYFGGASANSLSLLFVNHSSGWLG